MKELFQQLLSISVVVFPVTSMLAVGLGFTLRDLAGPFRHPERVFRALVANFVLVPLLAIGIARMFSLEPGLAAGLILVGTAAGAAFLIKLAQGARANVALGASMLVLLVPLTVLYMPLVVPLLVTDASVSPSGIAMPLILTMIVPLLVGLVVDSIWPRWAARLLPPARTISSLALVVLVVSTLVINAPLVVGLIGSGAIAAAFLLILGAFAAGYLLASPGGSRRTIMGLGTAQRNIAAAMVVASQDFEEDPNVSVMVVIASVIGLLVLFPIAWALRRRRTRTLITPAPGHEVLAGTRA